MSGGEITSFLETVIPAWVAKWKPSSLKASSTRETAEAPYTSTSAATMSLTSRFFSERLTNSNPSGSQSSSSAAASARSIRSLKMIRPTVVRKCSFSARRYSARSWSLTRSFSNASSASWAERNARGRVPLRSLQFPALRSASSCSSSSASLP